MAIHFGCAFDQAYIPKMWQYAFLQSFSALEGVEKFALVDVSDDIMRQLREMFPTIRFEMVRKTQYRVQGQIKVLPSPQYGAFIDFVPWVKDDDHVVFIDGDITVQRQLRQDEIDAFTKEPDRMAATMNARGDGSMKTELLHLNPKLSNQLWMFEKVFGDLSKPLYNLGVMGLNPPEWRRFLKIYEDNFDFWDSMLRHHASNQFFMSYMLNNLGFKLYDPTSDFVKNFHAHCHEADSIRYFGLKRGPDGRIMRGSEAVLLAHAHLHPSWQHLL